RSFSGDPGRNDSYFAWNQPISSVADGVVAEVIDDVPDNFGNQPNPANNPRRNARIVVMHSGRPRPSYSIYVHVRQGSALVRAGQRVRAGQQLASLGNAGFSSEPHLHLAYFTFDNTGRVRALPLAFAMLTRAGVPVAGVPQGGQE